VDGQKLSTRDQRLKSSLAVVIASKNREPDALKCLSSILKQPTQPDQIIVVDQSRNPYKLEHFPNIIHTYHPNLSGLPAARNHALSLIETEFVLFLDDDAELLEDSVAAFKQGFVDHPDAAAFGCLIERPYRLSALGCLRPMIFEHGFFNRAPIRRIGKDVELRTLNGCAMVVRVSVLEAERFDETLTGYALGEDFEFAKRARRYGKFWQCEYGRIFHGVSETNRLSAQRARRDLWDHYLYFYDKLGAGKNVWNRLWLLAWALGESLQWVRLGMGLPPIWAAMRRPKPLLSPW
jgi:GT2 family glycosyltransferase